MDDDAVLPTTAAEYRERSEYGRVQARLRYRDHLTEVLGGCGVDDAATVADVVLDALTGWRYIDTGERCTCSCHPRLPDCDRHDYGFDCVCSRTREQRRDSFQQVFNETTLDGCHVHTTSTTVTRSPPPSERASTGVQRAESACARGDLVTTRTILNT